METVNQNIADTNQSDDWTFNNNELLSRTQTNLTDDLASTPTNAPFTEPHRKRDEFESAIEEFSKLWSTQDQQHRSDGLKNRTFATNNNKNDDNYSKRNGALKSGGVPLTLEVDSHAWDLPVIANRK